MQFIVLFALLGAYAAAAQPLDEHRHGKNKTTEHPMRPVLPPHLVNATHPSNATRPSNTTWPQRLARSTAGVLPPIERGGWVKYPFQMPCHECLFKCTEDTDPEDPLSCLHCRKIVSLFLLLV